MTAVAEVRITTPWGACHTATCSVVGVRCDKGMCPECCDAKHKDTEGKRTHRERGIEELAKLTPEYTPETPTLVGQSIWEEVL